MLSKPLLQSSAGVSTPRHGAVFYKILYFFTKSMGTKNVGMKSAILCCNKFLDAAKRSKKCKQEQEIKIKIGLKGV